MTVATAERWLSVFCALRTARKTYRCACHIAEFHGEQEDGRGEFCDRYIAIGERYVESLDSQPAYRMECPEHNGSIVSRQPHRHAIDCRAPFLTQLNSDGRDCPRCKPGTPNTDYERLR